MVAHPSVGFCVYWLECFRHRIVSKAEIKLLVEVAKRQKVHKHINLYHIDMLWTETRSLSLEELGCTKDSVHRLDRGNQLMPEGPGKLCGPPAVIQALVPCKVSSYMAPPQQGHVL